MPNECKKALDILYEKYHVIEVDHEMSVEQKIPHMIQWYNLSHESMIACHIDKPLLKLLVNESRAMLRFVTQPFRL
jgi:hypothetical protein